MLPCAKQRPTSRSRWVCGAVSWAGWERREEMGCSTGEQGTRPQLGSTVFAVGAGLLLCCELWTSRCAAGTQALLRLLGHKGDSTGAHICWWWERGAGQGRAELAWQDPAWGWLDPTAALPSHTHPTQVSGTLVAWCLPGLS